MHYGGDYNPEQWPEALWPEDVRLMREAGVTMVSLGIFAWSRIQPAEGEFDWGWLDRVMDLLHDGGIGVDLATATASPPPWAIEAYPQMLPQDERGATLWHGSRQHYAPSSPEYRRLAAELVTALAARYAKHPAVVMWHVNNEYGCHLHADYSDNAAVAFRRWLADRYGTIDALNAAWGTDFWSQRYTAFSQVVPPRLSTYSRNPAGVLDFKRFSSDALLELFLMEKRIIRESGATQPITTNLLGPHLPTDYWRWAKELDVISDDCYPDPNDPESFRGSAFARDLMRSLKPDVPWILMEQSTSALNWRPANAPKAPGQMQALSMQAIARGADGVLFFQWRQSRSGSEKFHSAMVPHAGLETRTWREVVGLGGELAALPALPAGARNARVAIVFDWENWWAVSNADHPVPLDYLALVQRWYSAIHRRHVQVDIVHPAGDLGGYRVVIAPQLYLLTEDAAANLTAFAEGGGHLLVSAFSDVVDEHDAFRPGGFLTQLGGTLGVRLEEFGALVPPVAGAAGAGASAGDAAGSGDAAGGAGAVGSAGAAGVAGTAGPGQVFAPILLHAGSGAGGAGGRHDGGIVIGTMLAEEIHALDAEVIGSFSGGRLDGRPAITRRAVLPGADARAAAAAGTDSGGSSSGTVPVPAAASTPSVASGSSASESGDAVGAAYYVATVPDEAGCGILADLVFAAAGIEPLVAGLPPFVEAARRGDVLTLINHGSETVTVGFPEAAVVAVSGSAGGWPADGGRSDGASGVRVANAQSGDQSSDARAETAPGVGDRISSCELAPFAYILLRVQP